MTGEVITGAELLDYLGVDEQEAGLVESLRAYALETLEGADPVLVETRNEAIRVQVWLSYYAVRDAAGNTGFLREYLADLTGRLNGGTGA